MNSLPPTVMGFALRSSGRHQAGLALLAVMVFGLSAVPLELQRRIVNDAIRNGAAATILWLALAYAGVALVEQTAKLALNLYRAWVSESCVRSLRQTVHEERATAPSDDAGARAAMMLSEAEPIGGFVGIVFSEPLLQAGILCSVVIYMVVLEPWMALLVPALLAPQMIFVPLMQRAINRRAAARIRTLRHVSADIVDGNRPGGETVGRARIERVFTLNMGIYRIKYRMNLLMNLMQYCAVATALGIGGLFVLQGRVEVGTVVAIVSGLGKLYDPWGDLVNWAREFSVVSVKYRLFAETANRLASVAAPA